MLATSAGGVLVAVLGAGACGTPYGEAKLQDNAADASFEGTAPGIESCPLLHPIGQPDDDDDPLTELPAFVLAIDNVKLASDTDSFGYDIDNVCTCDTRDRGPHDAGSSCVPKKAVHCDGDGGVDNSFNAFLQTFPTDYSLDESVGLQKSITTGAQSFLLHFHRYNGLANDRDVEVGFLPSNGVRTAGCPGSVADDDGNYPPQWCGDDVWTTLPDATFRDGMPVAFANGYVRNYQFVVTLPATVRIPFGPTPLEFGTPIVTGKLVPLAEDMTPRPADQAPKTDREKRYFKVEGGVLTGRMNVEALLGALGAASMGDGTRLCQSPLYRDVRKRVCDAVDVARTPALDFQADQPCDSMSAAVGFTAKPAIQGPSYRDPGKNNDCLPVDGKPKVPTKYAQTYSCDDGELDAGAGADASP
ncbi:hypothetical protein AKJ09_09910 [Labilithrix luteola]|uniref:Uncharacterized protein n=1 Tax=Labilithrix luteola TaxID=1391654 RepID=A0A0K1QC68_9BACT|nr:hypothetical protein [Labilithrix luteola]AKV03247.1 hypothetical protein AKJ09_09910 [Labilithrix luteola]